MNSPMPQASALGQRDSAWPRQWLVACGAALALHAGVAAILLRHGDSPAGEQSRGAMALEVGIESAAPSFDGAAAAEASGASAATVSEEAVPAHEEAAPVSPTKQVADADQQADALQAPVEEPHDKQDIVMPATAAASQSLTAPSREAERESTQSIATSIGSSASAQRAQLAWRRELVAHIERQKRAMANAIRAADVVVRFTIDHRGRLLSLDIAKGSGDARYDQAALDIVRRADPMPPPPPDLPGQNLNFRIPISFRAGG